MGWLNPSHLQVTPLDMAAEGGMPEAIQVGHIDEARCGNCEYCDMKLYRSPGENMDMSADHETWVERGMASLGRDK